MRVPEFALGAKRQRLELQTPLQSFRFASGRYVRVKVGRRYRFSFSYSIDTEGRADLDRQQSPMMPAGAL
jgi:NAD(P)H-flavin reductase